MRSLEYLKRIIKLAEEYTKPSPQEGESPEEQVENYDVPSTPVSQSNRIVPGKSKSRKVLISENLKKINRSAKEAAIDPNTRSNKIVPNKMDKAAPISNNIKKLSSYKKLAFIRRLGNFLEVTMNDPKFMSGASRLFGGNAGVRAAGLGDMFGVIGDKAQTALGAAAREYKGRLLSHMARHPTEYATAAFLTGTAGLGALRLLRGRGTNIEINNNIPDIGNRQNPMIYNNVFQTPSGLIMSR